MKRRVLITGGSGLVGRHLQDIMPEAVYVSSKIADLTDYDETCDLFYKQNYDTVVQ